MLGSVRTILGCRRNGGNHFALGTRQGARAEEHDAAQGGEGWADAVMG
jgi:hypothetical protein